MSDVFMQLQTQACAADEIRVLEVRGREALNRPYAFELRFLARDWNLQAKDLLLAPATLTLRAEGPSLVRHGVLGAVEAWADPEGRPRVRAWSASTRRTPSPSWTAGADVWAWSTALTRRKRGNGSASNSEKHPPTCPPRPSRAGGRPFSASWPGTSPARTVQDRFSTGRGGAPPSRPDGPSTWPAIPARTGTGSTGSWLWSTRRIRTISCRSWTPPPPASPCARFPPQAGPGFRDLCPPGSWPRRTSARTLREWEGGAGGLDPPAAALRWQGPRPPRPPVAWHPGPARIPAGGSGSSLHPGNRSWSGGHRPGRNPRSQPP